MKTKSQIRNIMKKRLAQLGSISEQSLLIWKKILSHPKVLYAHSLAIFDSLADEPQLQDVWKQLADEKTLYLPKYDRTEIYHQPQLIHYQSWELAHGAIDVCIVPGRAFTRDGHRLWRWWWWYDRLLKATPFTYTIGVGFDEQIVEQLPQETHDIVLHEVITAS